MCIRDRLGAATYYILQNIVQAWHFQHADLISLAGVPVFMTLAWVPYSIIYFHLLAQYRTLMHVSLLILLSACLLYTSGYFKLVEAGRDLFGYDYIQPVHQGRAAEKVLFSHLLGKGKFAISNMFFDTTRAHVELTGARCFDCVVKEARKLSIRAPFKGNMDLSGMEPVSYTHLDVYKRQYMGRVMEELGPRKAELVDMHKMCIRDRCNSVSGHYCVPRQNQTAVLRY